jgi:hypothetical protein
MAPRFVALITASALVLLLPASASATHVRPIGATPKYDPLVITYENCTSPGGAIHTPSSTQGQRFACTPAIPSSPYLTAGTPDSNGAPADFIGSVRLDVCPATSCGTADVFVTVKMDGVHCKPALVSATPGVCPGSGLPPYIGSVLTDIQMEITDHCNKPSGGGSPCPTQPGLAASVSSISLPAIVQCANVGGAGRCNLSTSLNAISAGFIPSGYRMNVESTVRVLDGGSDGNANTVGNTFFATEGFFVP